MFELLVLTAGIQAKRLEVWTNLATSPLYFVGVHRAVSRQQGSFSTWTVVALDDPSHLENLVEVSGFAENGGSGAPTSVSGTMRVSFSANAPTGTGGAGSRMAALGTDVEVPALRLTYTP